MIHAICDFCGKDTDSTATLLTLTPFQNFARYHRATKPFGTTGEPKSFVICSKCAADRKLPNPYNNYEKITSQATQYEKCLNNYTEKDIADDSK